MATVVKMPKWGLTMTTGTVTDWHRDEGAEVSAGDPLLTVETEKAINDVESPADGVLVKIVAGQGAEVPVSAAVAIIAAPGEALTEAEIAALIESTAPKKAGAAARPALSAPAGREARAAGRDDAGRINASPAARKRAAELGVDLAGVEATGPNGRITIEDVERAAEELAADPSPREERITLADGREINLLVAGPGKSRKLVFIHGLGGSLSTWQVVLGELAEQYRVAAVDLPGHGASAKRAPADADYSVTGLANAVSEAMASAKLAPAVLVGHSLGGAVAMRVALDRPDLVEGLVLINSSGLGAEISANLMRLMSGEPGPETARGLLALFYENQTLVADRGVNEMAQTQLVEGAWAAQRAVAQAAFGSGKQATGVEGQASGIVQPVLVVWGAEDRVIPLAHATAAAGQFPDALLKVMPGVGHVPQVEDAAAVAKAIDRFAKSLD